MPIVFECRAVAPPQKAGTLAITTASPLPNALENTAYSTQFQAQGGVPPYTWTLANFTAYTLSVLPATATVVSSNTGPLITNSVTVTPTGGGPVPPPYVVQWSFISGGAGITISNPNSLTTTFTGTPASPLTGTAQCVVKDPLGRSLSITVPVSISNSSLQVTTTSLSGAVVGSPYSQALTASGGSGAPYSFIVDSCTPNTGGWLAYDGNLHLVGTPQMVETESVTIRAVDSAGNLSSPITLSLACTATGALAVQTTGLPSSPGAVQGGFYSYQLIASGGVPPYTWSWPAAQPWWVTPDGWIEGTPTTSGTVAFNGITVADSAGTIATATNLSLTVYASTSNLIVAGIDRQRNALYLPPATVGNYYYYQFIAYGETGSYTFAQASVSLPTGLNLSSNGVLSGIPTHPGDQSFTIQVTSGSLSPNVTVVLPIRPFGQVSRPSYNNNPYNGFFVLNGKLYDPNGYPFTIRGIDRNHYDSNNWATKANGALSGANACRFFMFTLNTSPTTPDAATYSAVALNEMIDNGIVPIITASMSPDGTSLSGNTSVTELNNTVTWFTNNISTLCPSTVMPYCIINLANEWGPGNSATWQSAYQTAVVNMRNAGYTCPLMIDTGSSGQDPLNIMNFAAGILSADPLRNCIFSYHAYGNTLNLNCAITNIVSSGGSTTITLNNNSTTHPFSFGSFPGNNYTGFAAYYITGVNGVTSINGVQNTTHNNIGGVQGAWTVTIPSVFSGTYTGGGYIAPYDTSAQCFYQKLIADFAALAPSNICVVLGEYGPGQNIGPSPTIVTPGQIVTAAETYGLGTCQWAWDDNNGSGGTTGFDNWFGMTLTGPGAYALNTPSDLTAPGMDALLNPRHGLVTTSSPAPVFQTNWNPGYYLLTYNQPWTYNTPASYISSDVTAAVSSGSTIKGYAAWAQWSFFEGGTAGSGTQGDYSNVANNGTSAFAQMMSSLQTNNQKLVLLFLPDVFDTGTLFAPATTSNSVVPKYILNNPTLYGNGIYGSSGVVSTGASGFWVQLDGGWCANWINANVQTAMLAAIKNFAQQWDGNPYLEAFVMVADDVMQPYTGSGISQSTYYSTLASIMLSIKSYFKRTNVGLQIAGNLLTEGQQYIQDLVTGGVLVSCSDTAGATAWNDTYKSFTFANPPAGTSGTLTSAFPWPGNNYTVKLSTGQVVTMTTNSSGSTAVTFSPAITGSPTTSATCNYGWPQLGPAMQAWAGIQSPGSTWAPPSPALQTYSTAIMFAEEGDFWNTVGTKVYPTTFHVTDMAAACNDQVTGGVGYHASHLLLSYGNSTVWAARLAEAQSIALTNIQTPA